VNDEQCTLLIDHHITLGSTESVPEPVDMGEVGWAIHVPKYCTLSVLRIFVHFHSLSFSGITFMKKSIIKTMLDFFFVKIQQSRSACCDFTKKVEFNQKIL